MDDISRLALDARDGDDGALVEFIRGTQRDVLRFVAHLLDPASAEDVAQEVYLRALKGLSSYRGDAPARAWLLTIARRTCADVIRRRQRDRRLWGRLTTHRASDRSVAQPDDGHVEVSTLVAALEEERRTAFVLTQIIGLPYAEAAAVCDVPVGTIRSRVSRARSDLIAALEADAPSAQQG